MKADSTSYSADRKLRRCEQQYSYRYDEKLKARVKSKGLYMGDVMHQLLKAYRTGTDWKEAFKQWKASSWEKLFEEEREMYEEKKMTPKLVYSLFSHYVNHWTEQQALWKPLFIEKMFEITTKKGLLIRFAMDYVVQEGKLTVMVENKNKEKIPSSEERILDPQVHMYCYLATKLPEPLHIDKIIWDYIRTLPVSSPSLNKNGTISKKRIETDQRTYLRFLKDNDIKVEDLADAVGIQNTIRNLPETISLERVMNKPNLKVGKRFVEDMVSRAERAKLITRPTRNWNRSCKWECDYRILCEADILGYPDRDAIIKKDFVTAIKGAENGN